MSRFASPAAIAISVLVGCDGAPRESSAAAGTPQPEAKTDPTPEDAPDDPEPGTLAIAGDTGEPATAETGHAEAPAPDVKPEDYGVVKPPVAPPAEDELTIHALAGLPVVAIYTQPDLEAPRLGYLRFGQRMMVGEKVEDEGEGCRKGFHALPAGGFACASKGLLVDPDKEPYMYLPPDPPRLEEPLPYDYGTIGKDGTPMWWRTADRDEVRLADEKYAATVAPPEPEPGKTSPKPSKPSKPSKPPGKPAGDGAALPGVGDTPPPPAETLTEEQRAELERKREEARIKAEERAAELAKKAANLPLNSDKPFLEKGFIITLSQRVKDKGRGWWRTARGGFVETSRAWRRKTKDFQGAEVPEGSGFPFGFVVEEKVAGYKLDDEGKLKRERKLEYREFVDFAEEVEVGGKPYMVTADGMHVRKKDLRLAEAATRPEEVAPWEGWIDVSLERQILVAYEGDQPVYATLVSTGKKGTKEESFETPTGTWRIQSKHVSSSMDGNTASDGNYSIQDVPWTMFFEGSYALHGAFWHSRFGRRRSHGCVNLGPTDARWLFNWTTPVLPEGWHGVKAHEGAPGTLIVVR